MRKLSILASLLLVLALAGGSAMAVPVSPGDGAVIVTDDGTSNDEGGSSTSTKPRTTRDKWGSKKPSAPSKPKEKPKYKPWKEVTKDAEVKEGLIKTYVKDEDVYFAIKEDQLDKPMALFMNLSKGMGARFVLGGLPISGTIMFDFHREKDHIQVRQLNTLFRAPRIPRSRSRSI